MEQEIKLVVTHSEDSLLAPSDERELTASPIDHGTTMHASTEQLLDDDDLNHDEKTQEVAAGGNPSSEDSTSYRSTIPADHSSTLLFPLPNRPLSTAADNNTEGDLIYDRLPATLQRSEKPPAGGAKANYPTVVPPKPSARVQNRDLESQGQKKKKVDLAKKSSPHPHPNNHMILTIVSMVLCGLILNIFAFICLIPAYIFAKKSTQSAEHGATGKAEDYAKKTFLLNIIAVFVTFIAILTILIITQVVFGAVVY